MSRVYNAQTMVALPKMTGTQTSTLIRQLITRAGEMQGSNEGALPVDIARALARMTSAHEALVKAKLPTATPASDAASEADQAVDNAWRVLNSWLYAWTIMPDGSHPLLTQIRALYGLLFDDMGLKFINEAYLVEWQESQYRLEAIFADGYEPIVEGLGGRALLDQLQAAQKRYGEALGVTVTNEPAPDPRYKEQMYAALEACRLYVGRVAMYPDPEIPGSEELARMLLQPVES